MDRVQIQVEPSRTLRSWWWWCVLVDGVLSAFGLTYTRDQAAEHAGRAAAELRRQEGRP